MSYNCQALLMAERKNWKQCWLWFCIVSRVSKRSAQLGEDVHQAEAADNDDDHHINDDEADDEDEEAKAKTCFVQKQEMCCCN